MYNGTIHMQYSHMRAKRRTDEAERMELRTLKYFLTVIQEGSISNAAKALGVTQPTLSRQLAALEDELGKQLYNRTHKGIVLTEQGVILQRYAQSIVALADKAEAEISLPAQTISGTVHVAMGEAPGLACIGQAMATVQADYPGISFEVTSGNQADLIDGLVSGRFDVLAECDVQPHADMNVLPLPDEDSWGLLVRAESPLASLDAIDRAQLKGQRLIVPDQGLGGLREWAGGSLGKVGSVVATYNHPLAGRLLVEQGMGAMFALNGLFATGGDTGLAFVTLEPHATVRHGLVWPKKMPSKPAQVFIQEMQRLCDGQEGARK